MQVNDKSSVRPKKNIRGAFNVHWFKTNFYVTMPSSNDKLTMVNERVPPINFQHLIPYCKFQQFSLGYSIV